MGWREREWARLDAEELSELYGVAPRSARRPARTSARAVVWTSVLVVTLAVSAIAWWSKAATTSSVPAGLSSRVVFGDLPRPNTAIAPDAPGGSDTICTEAEAVGFGWRCDTWAIVTPGMRGLQAKAFTGPCAHRVVDQATGSWVCTEAAPPSGSPS